jgi:uncharacterized protein YlxW (UPF0749 family)
MIEGTIILLVIVALAGAVTWANHGVPPAETTRQRTTREKTESLEATITTLQKRVDALEANHG